jgi:hypothetical protein
LVVRIVNSVKPFSPLVSPVVGFPLSQEWGLADM